MTIHDAPSPNHSPRPPGCPIDTIVLHDTGAYGVLGTLAWFRSSASKVSSHYVIDRDGTVYRCVPESEVAWHAGVSSLHGVPNVNARSIGIELTDADDTDDPYPAPQMAALVEVVADCCRRYRISLNRVVGHRDVAEPHGRKNDPGQDFDPYTFLLAVAERLTHPDPTEVPA